MWKRSSWLMAFLAVSSIYIAHVSTQGLDEDPDASYGSSLAQQRLQGILATASKFRKGFNNRGGAAVCRWVLPRLKLCILHMLQPTAFGTQCDRSVLLTLKLLLPMSLLLLKRCCCCCCSKNSGSLCATQQSNALEQKSTLLVASSPQVYDARSPGQMGGFTAVGTPKSQQECNACVAFAVLGAAQSAIASVLKKDATSSISGEVVPHN